MRSIPTVMMDMNVVGRTIAGMYFHKIIHWHRMK